MITSQDIVQLIKAADIEVDPAALRDDLPLTDQGVDSLDMATVLFHVEQEYTLVIPAEDSARLRTVRHLVEYVNANRS